MGPPRRPPWIKQDLKQMSRGHTEASKEAVYRRGEVGVGGSGRGRQPKKNP